MLGHRVTAGQDELTGGQEYAAAAMRPGDDGRGCHTRVGLARGAERTAPQNLASVVWSSIQATPTGLRFIETLPLAEPRTPASGAETAIGPAPAQQAPEEQAEITQVADL